MVLLEYLKNKEVVAYRGKRVNIPAPPHEFAARDYLEHLPDVHMQHAKHSIERSATNYIVAALHTPVPPFMQSTVPIVPVPDPHMSPHRSTLRLASPRWTSPQLRDANQLHYVTPLSTCSVAETFFEKVHRSDGTVDVSMKKTVVSPRRRAAGSSSLASPSSRPASSAPRQAAVSTDASVDDCVSRANRLSSNGCTSLSSTVSSAALQRRSPRHMRSKFVYNEEGLIVMDKETSIAESRLLAGVPAPVSESAYQYRSTVLDRDMHVKQRQFEQALLSPRSVRMDLGIFEMMLNKKKDE